MCENDIEIEREGARPIDALAERMVKMRSESSEARTICPLANTDDEGNEHCGFGIGQINTADLFSSIIAAGNRKWR